MYSPADARIINIVISANVSCCWNLLCVMAMTKMISMVLALWRFLKYLEHRTHFSLKPYHSPEFRRILTASLFIKMAEYIFKFEYLRFSLDIWLRIYVYNRLD